MYLLFQDAEEVMKELINHYSVISYKFVSENFLDPDGHFSYLTYTLRQMGFARYKGGKRITINGRRVRNIWYNKSHFRGREPTRVEIEEYLNRRFNYGIDFYTANIANIEEWEKRIDEDRGVFNALFDAKAALEEKNFEEVARCIKEAYNALIPRYEEDRI